MADWKAIQPEPNSHNERFYTFLNSHNFGSFCKNYRLERIFL